MGYKGMYYKKITIITVIVFGVFFSFQAFYNAFVDDYDITTSLIKGSFNYNLDAPDDKIELDDEYEEISGIDIQGDYIYFVIDEGNGLFVYNIKSNKVEVIRATTGDGDFEGFAITDTADYMIESNGNLIKNRFGYINIVSTYKAKFTEENNIEGLCYDKDNNRLLIACKHKPLKGIEHDHKGIYSFDLNKNEYVYEAVYDVSNKDVYGDKRKKKDNFGPSGIAIHPITKEVYIIAHEGKVIFALNNKGKVVRSKRLDPKIFKQPEGICFNEQGDMYISNEGDGGKANILKFNYTAE